MPNLSQLRRQKMLECLHKIKEAHNSDDEILIALGEIENELLSKKYGLVWEEHEENVDVQMRTGIPVFTEVKEREISTAPEQGYNFIIEGDNLHSLYLLEKTHRGKIDVVYIDPPYNRGKDDFIYDDDYIDSTDSFRHSKWISFMSQRLKVAYNLLTDDGVLFLSIDENEFAQAKMLCDEIFTESGFVECIIWNKRVPKNDKGIGNIHEYILLYEKKSSQSVNEANKFMMPKDGLDEIFDFVDKLKRKNIPLEQAEEMLKDFYNRKGYDRAITLYCQLDKNYDIWGKINMCWPNGHSVGPAYDVLHPIHKKPVTVPSRGWRWKEETLFGIAGYNQENQSYTDMEVLYDGSVICKGGDKRAGVWFSDNLSVQPSSIKYLRDLDRMLFRSIYSTKSDGSIALENIIAEQDAFEYPKPPKLIYDLLDSALYNKQTAIILDFFAGSGTTGEAVLQLNADTGKQFQFILCTNNELDVFQKLRYIHDCGYMTDYQPNKTVKADSVKSKIEKFFEDNPHLYEELFKKTANSEEYGICRHITYPRVSTVITGKRTDGTNYSGGIPSNLKYYRTDFVSREEEYISDALLEHITEMVQLEHGVKIDGKQYLILLDDDAVDELEKHWNEHGDVKALYISKNVLLTTKQNELFAGIEMHIIPDYYFKFELKEVGEVW